jgi:DNA-binding Lrp family transcriptional regulator
VIDYLESNPAATVNDVARGLAISLAAARKRLQRLLNAGVLSPRFGINLGYSRFGARSIVFLKIALNKLRRRSQPGYSDLRQFVGFLRSGLNKSPEWANFFKSKDAEALAISDAYSLSGAGMGIDIILVISGTSEALIREFVTDVVGALNGVDESNTSIIAADGTFELELSRNTEIR